MGIRLRQAGSGSFLTGTAPVLGGITLPVWNNTTKEWDATEVVIPAAGSGGTAVIGAAQSIPGGVGLTDILTFPDPIPANNGAVVLVTLTGSEGGPPAVTLELISALLDNAVSLSTHERLPVAAPPGFSDNAYPFAGDANLLTWTFALGTGAPVVGPLTIGLRTVSDVFELSEVSGVFFFV